jgi:hypothetical protein
MANPLAETYLTEATKLNGENYINWKFKMQTQMEGYNVWYITSSKEVKPDAFVGATTASIQDWEKCETTLKGLLRMFVKDSLIPHIRDCSTSVETWTTLKDLYESKNTNQVLSLKSLAAREKALTFEELAGILMQEEER